MSLPLPPGAPPVSAASTAAGAAPPGIDANLIANLHQYLVVSPQLAVLADRLGLKRLLPMAVDRAIVEIITPVVERSVTIACMTAQELVLKDFATEPDAEVMRASAHLMVTGLAQSLSLVTCKEPLRVALGNNLRQLMQVAGFLLNVAAVLIASCLL